VPGTCLFEAELGARSAQIIPICVIGAGSDKIGEAAQNGGSGASGVARAFVPSHPCACSLRPRPRVPFR
jgi:hypothetical protein